MPQTVCHFVDKDSPFFDMSARDLLSRRFEIVLSLTGISRHTGQATQARTSYLSTEILWGHRFQNVITYDWEGGQYVADVDRLDEIEQVDTPLCSAARLSEILDEVHDALEKETVNSFCINRRLEEFYEEDDDDESHYEGLQMKKTEEEKCKKFNVTRVEE